MSPWHWWLHVERPVRPVAVVVLDIELARDFFTVDNNSREIPAGLYVVDGIRWTRAADRSVHASSGNTRWWKDWTTEDASLTATRDRYVLPPGGTSRKRGLIIGDYRRPGAPARSTCTDQGLGAGSRVAVCSRPHSRPAGTTISPSVSVSPRVCWRAVTAAAMASL